MKKLFLAVIAFITSNSILPAQSFEGSYLMHIENAQRKSNHDMQMTFKGDKSCMEILTEEKAGKFKTIFDNKEKTMTILTEKDGANKMAMVRKMPESKEFKGKEDKNAKITVTDETKTIEGYKCKKVIAESDESNTEMWVTDELGLTYADMFGMINRGSGPASNMAMNMQNYNDVKGIPLEMHTKNKNKPGENTDIFIKNIKKGNVDASMFDISGYQVMDMSKLGGGR